MTRQRKAWLLPASVVVALLLGLLPLPASLLPLRPYWLALVVAYWVIEDPDRAGLGFAFIVGVLADLVFGSLLGEQALRLVVMAFILQRFRARIRFFPMSQQALAIGGLLLNDRIVTAGLHIVRAALDARAGLLLPVHWGTFDLALHGWTEPMERVLVAADSQGVRVASPRPGGMVETVREVGLCSAARSSRSGTTSCGTGMRRQRSRIGSCPPRRAGRGRRGARHVHERDGHGLDGGPVLDDPPCAHAGGRVPLR